MPKPTIAQLFGANAAVITAQTPVDASAADPVLCIKLSDLAATGFNQAASTTDAEAWLGALIKMAASFTAANTDEKPRITVEAPTADSFLSISSRDGIQRLQLPYSVTVYENFAGSVSFDPDNLA